MKANMGLLPELQMEIGEQIRGKANRYAAYADRAQCDFSAYLCTTDFAPLPTQPALLAA
jgi:hypothetical protein